MSSVVQTPDPVEHRRAAPSVELGPVLVHVGYHRTGTTWLQRQLFRNARAGLGLPLSKGTEIPPALVLPHPLDFDPASSRAALHPPLLRTQESGLMPVLSSERLVGPPHAGGYDSKEMADRVKAVLPTARILIGIREQCSVIASTYKNYVKAGGPASLHDYLYPRERRRSVPRFDFKHFEYDRLIGYYQGLFGPERVLVVPFERLTSDGPSLVADIIRFAGATPSDGLLEELPYETPRNESLDGVAIAAKRHLNLLFSSQALNPRPVLPLKSGDRVTEAVLSLLQRRTPRRFSRHASERMRHGIAAAVGDRYADSNRRTSELTGLPLDRYGYDCAISRASSGSG